MFFFCLVFVMPLFVCLSVYLVPCGHLMGKG